MSTPTDAELARSYAGDPPHPRLDRSAPVILGPCPRADCGMPPTFPGYCIRCHRSIQFTTHDGARVRVALPIWTWEHCWPGAEALAGVWGRIPDEGKARTARGESVEWIP